MGGSPIEVTVEDVNLPYNEVTGQEIGEEEVPSKTKMIDAAKVSGLL